MSDNILIALLQNTALLLTLVILYDIFYQEKESFGKYANYLIGFIIGIIGISLMLSHWKYSSQVIFDTRTVLLSISGLFFGFIPTAIAVIMTSILRIWQGGGGMLMGVSTIFSSAALGIAWRKRLQKNNSTPSKLQLYIFGITVHLVMIFCMIFLPKDVAFHVFKTVSLPVILIYPVGTVLLGLVMIKKQKRKQMEEDLANAETYYRTLSDSGQALIWTAGTDKKCDYFNQPWLDFTGRKIEQELGDGWVEGVHPDDLQRCVTIYTEAFDKREKFSMQYRLRHAGGEYRWIQDDGTPRFNSKGQFIGYIGHCLDINLQKKMETTQAVLYEISNAVHTTKDIQELYYQIHQLLGKLIDTTNFYIATYEQTTNIVSVPYFIDERDTLPPPNKQLKQGLTAYVIQSKKPLFLTVNKRDQMIQNGEIPDLNWQAKVWLGIPLISREKKIIGAMAVQSYTNENAFSEHDLQLFEFVSDHVALAIEQKQADDEIHLKSLVLDQIQDLVTITDLNGSITYVNQAELTTMGFSYDEIIGKTTHIYGEDFQEGASQQEINEQTLQNGKWRGEVVNLTKDGSKRIMDCRTQIIYDSDGNAVAMCGISTDITERKQMEQILALSEEKFRTTLQSIGDAVITTDTNGKIQYMNPIAEELTGWNLDEVIGKDLHEIFNIINETTREQVEIPTQKVLREGKIVGLANHTLLITKHGEEIPIADSGAPIKNEAGEIIGVVLVFRDQTQERAARIKLERSEAALQYAQELSNMGSFELDLVNHVLRWSENNYRLMGYKPYEIKPTYELFINKIHPEDLEMVKATLEQMQNEKKPLRYEFRVIINGKTKWLQNDVIPIFEMDKMVAMKGVDIDITQRKTAEEHLFKQEKKFRLMIQNSKDIIAMYDKEGIIHYKSPGIQEILGLEPDEVLGMSVFDLVLEADREIAMEHFIRLQTLKTGESINFEIRAKHKNGSYRWLDATITNMLKDHDLSAFIGNYRDITKRKRMAERIQKINETLLNLTPNYLENIQSLTRLFGTLIGAACALYNRLDEGLLYSYGKWNTPPEFNPHDKPDGHICYDVIQKSQAEVLLVRDLSNSKYYETDPNVSQYNLQTYIGKAVKCNDSFVGSLCGVFVDDFEPSDDDNRLLGIIAAAIGIEEARWQAKKALMESEARFKGIYENAIVGIYRTTPDGKILMANPWLIKMLGFDSFEELSKRDLSIEGPSSRHEFIQNIEKNGMIIEHEDEWKLKNGNTLYVLENAITMYDDEGKPIYYDGSVIDISKQKQAENILKKRLKIEQMVSKVSTELINIEPEKLDKKIENAMAQIGEFTNVDRVYIFLFDENKQFMNNAYEFCASEVTPEKENLQQLPVSFFPWWMEKLNRFETIHIPIVSDMPREASAEKEILESQNIQSVLVIPLVSNAKLYGFIGFDSVKKQKAWDEEDIMLLHLVGEIFINAILRVESRIALQESEERYDSFINTHKDLIFVKDENFRYAVVNDEMTKFFGKSRQEILNHTDFDLMEQNAAQNCANSDMEALTKRESVTIDETIGDKIYEVTKFPLLLKAGKVGVGGIIHDITKRKEAEVKIQKTLQEKEILLQEVYHRTKNNMQVIRSLMKIQAAHLQNEAITAFSQEIGQKILAMSLIHQKSYNAKDLASIELGNYAYELTRTLVSGEPSLSRKIKINFSKDEVVSHIETAMPFGLVMNELISHTLHESFTGIEEGIISFSIRRSEDGTIQVHYADNGKSNPSDYEIRTQGTLGLKNAILLIEMQLKGEIKFSSDNGFSCIIQFKDNLYKQRLVSH
jgi:PAS domain S-box-containing protein